MSQVTVKIYHPHDPLGAILIQMSQAVYDRIVAMRGSGLIHAKTRFCLDGSRDPDETVPIGPQYVLELMTGAQPNVQ